MTEDPSRTLWLVALHGLCDWRVTTLIVWLESGDVFLWHLPDLAIAFFPASSSSPLQFLVWEHDEGFCADSLCSTGNNYAIMNESSTHSAKIFFAQGCEIQASMNQFEDMGRESQSWRWLPFSVFLFMMTCWLFLPPFVFCPPRGFEVTVGVELWVLLCIIIIIVVGMGFFLFFSFFFPLLFLWMDNKDFTNVYERVSPPHFVCLAW